MKYLFLDTETGGLDKNRHDVLQIAWILTSDNFDIIASDNRFLQMTLTPTKEAIEINGLTGDFLKENACSPKDAYISLAQALREATCIIGHYVAFDLEMLDADVRRRLTDKTDKEIVNSIRLSLRSVPSFDTKKEYARLNPQWAARNHPGPYLDELCRFLGIKTEKLQFHRADSDVEALRLCMKQIKYLYSDTIQG